MGRRPELLSSQRGTLYAGNTRTEAVSRQNLSWVKLRLWISNSVINSLNSSRVGPRFGVSSSSINCQNFSTSNFQQQQQLVELLPDKFPTLDFQQQYKITEFLLGIFAIPNSQLRQNIVNPSWVVSKLRIFSCSNRIPNPFSLFRNSTMLKNRCTGKLLSPNGRAVCVTDQHIRAFYGKTENFMSSNAKTNLPTQDKMSKSNSPRARLGTNQSTRLSLL
jgi:hypothetical protein